HRHGFLLQLHPTSRETRAPTPEMRRTGGGQSVRFYAPPRRRSMKACAGCAPVQILQSCHPESAIRNLQSAICNLQPAISDSGSLMTDYERFVNTEALLACQRPLDHLVNSHDLFFQITHQVM